MKRSELLDLMGELDESYIEDAAKHLERNPRRIVQRWARPAGAAAAAGLLGFSVFMIYGIVRDGIASQQTDSYVQSAAHSPSDASETAVTAETVPPTVPPDLFEVQPETTTVTTVTETETTTTETLVRPSSDIPADEMPSAKLEQEVGSRFSVNWLSDPGILAMTVHDAQYYDSIEDAGLTVEDLTYNFRAESALAYGTATLDSAHQNVKTAQITEDGSWKQIKSDYGKYYFVKLTLTVENINGVCPDWLRAEGVLDSENGTIDRDFSRGEYDFDMTGMSFGVVRNPNYETEKHEVRAASFDTVYFSLCGQAYPKDDRFGRGDWFRLEPGETMTCEVGGFLPKTTDVHMLRDNFWTDEMHYEAGTDLLPYYYFGGGPMNGPHILLNLADAE